MLIEWCGNDMGNKVRKRILFLGGMYIEDNKNIFVKNSKRGIDIAADLFQWRLLNGLSDNENVEKITVASVPFILPFPKLNNLKKIRSYFEIINSKLSIYSLKFNNLVLYKNLSRYFSLRKFMTENKEIINESDTLLVYSLHTPLLKAALFAKKINPKIKLVVVVPDLPEYMDLNQRFIKKAFKKIDSKLIYSIVTKFDGYILLTEQMKQKLNLGNKPSIIIEGIAMPTNNKHNSIEILDNNYTNIVYTGGISKEYGVIDLVNGFHQIKNENIRLIICGSGKDAGYIENLSQQDNRIVYLGQVDNTIAVQLQNHADILVNPRPNIGEYTKYSFPSKTIEYLAAGKILIANKLDGIPSEYDEYIYYIDKMNNGSFKEALIEVISWSDEERDKFGKKAKDFILKNKTQNIVTSKILKFIDDINMEVTK